MKFNDEDSLEDEKIEENDIVVEDERPPKLTAVKQEFIHDVAFDYFGNKMVTCGADQKLKIWERAKRVSSDDDSSPIFSPTMKPIKNFRDFDQVTSPIFKKKQTKTEFSQNMYLIDEWEAHTGPITKVAYAHPQFGTIFASCTESSEVIIWEEKIAKKQWVQLTSLKVAKDKIQDIRFSPEHCGLKLLVLYTKGSIAIYQAKIVTELNRWKEICTINNICTQGCNAIDWLPEVNEIIDGGLYNYDMFAVA